MHHRKLRQLSWGLLLFVMLLTQITSPANAQGDAQSWLLGQINALRGQLGLHAYVWNGQLAAAAQQHSEYMATTGHISHTQSNGSTPASRAAANGYGGSFVSENIYGGGIAQASDAWNFWLNSPVHYAGMAHTRNNEIGIGFASGPNGNYYTLVFGYRRDINAPPAEPPPPSEGGDGGDGGSVPPANPAPARPAATRMPPTRTFTPSPTIPTLTPTVTWTYTATWTPSPTSTIPAATSTAIKLPTAAIVAALPTATPSPIRVASNVNEPSPNLGGSALNPSNNSTERPSMPIWVWLAGVVAILGIGFIFMGYGFHQVRKK